MVRQKVLKSSKVSQRFFAATLWHCAYSYVMDAFFDMIPPMALIAAMMVTFIGGVVKGAVGFALPMIMVSGMGVFMEPLLVVGGAIFSIAITNFYQVLRIGLSHAVDVVREYASYIGVTCAAVLLTSQVLPHVPTGALFVVLGVPVVLISVVQLAGLRLRISPELRGPASIIAGMIAGVLGGLAGMAGPPTVIYLMAIDTPKVKQVLVQGVVFGLGSLMMLAGHLYSGVLNRATIPLSLVLVIPALLGMMAGGYIQDRIDQTTFRRATLIVLMLAGANLIRRGLAG